MSILRAVIRSTAVGALRARTWAEERVYDSDMTPLSQALYGGPAKPYIVVYTDTDDLNPVTGIGDVYSGERRELNLVLEIGVASSVTDPSGKNTIVFAATDEGMEWACDVICAQSLAALVGDSSSQWGNLFKTMVQKIRKIYSRRGGMASSGVRYAARRLTLSCEPMWDLAPGRVPEATHPLNQFIILSRANPGLSEVDVAGIVESFLPTAPVPDWRLAQNMLGITDRAAEVLVVPGLPMAWPVDPNEQPAPLDDLEYPMDVELSKTDLTGVISPNVMIPDPPIQP